MNNITPITVPAMRPGLKQIIKTIKKCKIIAKNIPIHKKNKVKKSYKIMRQVQNFHMGNQGLEPFS